MITKLKEAETVHFDAICKVVPRIFYQLLTIFIRYYRATLARSLHNVFASTQHFVPRECEKIGKFRFLIFFNFVAYDDIIIR